MERILRTVVRRLRKPRSIGMISRKSEHPAKSPTHRRSTSQSMEALGNERRSIATAGAVWTMSPRELRRTIRKCSSAMRCFTETRKKVPRGVMVGVAHDSDADAKPGGGQPFWNRFSCVVGALGVDVGAQGFQQDFHIGLVKKGDVVHGAETCDKLRARVLRQDGPAGTFQGAHTRIRVDRHNKGVSLSPCRFEVAHVACVGQIEASIGQDDPLPFLAARIQDLTQGFPRQNFAARIEHRLAGNHRATPASPPVASRRIAASSSLPVTVAVPRFITTMPPAMLAMCAASTKLEP